MNHFQQHQLQPNAIKRVFFKKTRLKKTAFLHLLVNNVLENPKNQKFVKHLNMMKITIPKMIMNNKDVKNIVKSISMKMDTMTDRLK